MFPYIQGITLTQWTHLQMRVNINFASLQSTIWAGHSTDVLGVLPNVTSTRCPEDGERLSINVLLDEINPNTYLTNRADRDLGTLWSTFSSELQVFSDSITKSYDYDVCLRVESNVVNTTLPDVLGCLGWVHLKRKACYLRFSQLHKWDIIVVITQYDISCIHTMRMFR